MDTQQALKVLGLYAGASQHDVKAAYRILAKKWHPDVFLDLEQKHQAELKIKEINIAYQILKEYDRDSSDNDISTNNLGHIDPIVRTKMGNPELFYHQAQNHRKSGNLQEAIEACTQAIRLDADYLDAYKLRYDILIELGYSNRANSDDRHIRNLISKREKQEREQNPKNNRDRNSETRQLESDDPSFFYYRAQVRIKSKKILEAIQDCTIAIRLNPDYIDAYRLRQSLYSSLGQKKQAALDGEKIIEIQEGKRSSHTKKAQASKSKLSETYPSQTGTTDAERFQYSEVSAESSNSHSDQAKFFYNKALQESQNSNFREALYHCNKAIRINPDYLEVYEFRRSI